MYQHNFYDNESQEDSDLEENLDLEEEQPPQQQPPQKRRHWMRWLIIIALTILIGGFIFTIWQQMQWASTVMQNYQGLNNERVAQLQITATKKQHLYSVQVTIFNKKQKPTESFTCYMQPDGVLTFQGDDLNFAPALDHLGLHSGFKLTQLGGCSDDALNPDPYALTIINNGDDSFFVSSQGAHFSIASAHYSDPFTVQPAPLQPGQTETYIVYTSLNGLHAVLLNKPALLNSLVFE